MTFNRPGNGSSIFSGCFSRPAHPPSNIADTASTRVFHQRRVDLESKTRNMEKPARDIGPCRHGTKAASPGSVQDDHAPCVFLFVNFEPLRKTKDLAAIFSPGRNREWTSASKKPVSTVFERFIWTEVRYRLGEGKL